MNQLRPCYTNQYDQKLGTKKKTDNASKHIDLSQKPAEELQMVMRNLGFKDSYEETGTRTRCTCTCLVLHLDWYVQSCLKFMTWDGKQARGFWISFADIGSFQMVDSALETCSPKVGPWERRSLLSVPFNNDSSNQFIYRFDTCGNRSPEWLWGIEVASGWGLRPGGGSHDRPGRPTGGCSDSVFFKVRNPCWKHILCTFHHI